MTQTQHLSLDRVAPGARVIVKDLCADRELNSRLMLLGIVIDSAAEVLQSRDGGPMLIRVRNTLVAIGRDEAAKVVVELP